MPVSPPVAAGDARSSNTTAMTVTDWHRRLRVGSYHGFSASNEDFSVDNKVDLVRVGLN